MAGMEDATHRSPLSRERIVATALQIVDEEGLEALTMRRLARALDVVPMAIYYHVPNKAALYDGIVEAVMSEIDVTADDPSASFAERLKGAARAYRDVLVAHPHALPVIAGRPPRTVASLRPVEVLLRVMRDAGLSVPDAMAALDVVAALVQGAAWMETHGVLRSPDEDVEAHQLPPIGPEEFPTLAEAMACGGGMSFAEEFEFGLDTIVRGLQRERG